jgi:hypothetical protein
MILSCGYYFSFLRQFNLFSGYVDNIKQLLLSLEKAKFEEICKEHEKAVPKPLTTQFDERLSKSEAVKKHIEKKNAEKTTAAFPTSKILIFGHAFSLLSNKRKIIFEWFYYENRAFSGI